MFSSAWHSVNFMIVFCVFIIPWNFEKVGYVMDFIFLQLWRSWKNFTRSGRHNWLSCRRVDLALNRHVNLTIGLSPQWKLKCKREGILQYMWALKNVIRQRERIFFFPDCFEFSRGKENWLNVMICNFLIFNFKSKFKTFNFFLDT